MTALVTASPRVSESVRDLRARVCFASVSRPFRVRAPQAPTAAHLGHHLGDRDTFRLWYSFEEPTRSLECLRRAATAVRGVTALAGVGPAYGKR